MRNVIFMVILGVFSSYAYAGWSEIGSASDGKVYVDSTTIQRNNDAVKVWVLHDYTKDKVIEGVNYLSEKRLNEYDCKTAEVRSNAHFFFSKNMGSGDMVFSKEEISYWKLVEPASADYSNLKLACNRLYEVKSFVKRVIDRIIHLE